MKQYIISIADESKVMHLLNLLDDLYYVTVAEITKATSEKKFPLMDEPLHVADFKRYSRDELYER